MCYAIGFLEIDNVQATQASSPYFVSTNATGVKSSSAALNPVILPLHTSGWALIPFVRHTYRFVQPGKSASKKKKEL